MNAKRITEIALFTAAALILSVVESLLPPLMPFAPGAKMGLGNLVTLLAVIILGYSDAYLILALRCLLGSIFGGNVAALMYSVPAGIISLSIEILIYHFLYRWVSIMGISFVGALTHNFVQVAVASLMVGTSLAPILPLMLFASIIAGLGIGMVTFVTVKYLPKKFYADRGR